MSTVYTSYHIYGRRTRQARLKQLSGCWYQHEVREHMARYRREGWLDLRVQEKQSTRGLPIRSQTVKNPHGRWVIVFLAADLKQVKEARDAAGL